VPHPLRDEILITLLCDNEDTCRKVLATAASNLSKMFAQWRSEWEKMK
jgi:DNA-directed RNA polymerase subunit L